jgi:hypothetical protein
MIKINLIFIYDIKKSMSHQFGNIYFVQISFKKIFESILLSRPSIDGKLSQN